MYNVIAKCSSQLPNKKTELWSIYKNINLDENLGLHFGIDKHNSQNSVCYVNISFVYDSCLPIWSTNNPKSTQIVYLW